MSSNTALSYFLMALFLVRVLNFVIVPLDITPSPTCITFYGSDVYLLQNAMSNVSTTSTLISLSNVDLG